MKRKLLPFTAVISCLALVMFIATLGTLTVLPPSVGAQDGIAYADEPSADHSVSMSISSQTPIIGSAGSSTYSLTVSITNNSQSAITTGTLRVSTNPDMTFSTTSDMQQWAEGSLDIWASGVIDRQEVASIPPGSSVSVSASGSIDDFPLNEITTFGARPILVRYTTDDGTVQVDEHTFVTFDNGSSSTDSRTNTHVTIAAPVVAKSWTTDTSKLNDVLMQKEPDDVSSGSAAATQPSQTGGINRMVASVISANLATGAQAAVEAAPSHSFLSLVADPYCLSALAGSAVATSLLPPADADFTVYAQSDADWGAAGITTNSLSEAHASSIATASSSATSPQAASRTSRFVAWQGKGNWTAAALTAAQQAGYTTVVSLHGNTGTATSTYHAVTHTITDQGSVGILNAESTLSSLTSGNASSSAATAENSTAGRISRIIAQTSLGSVTQVSDSNSEAYSRLFIAIDPSSNCSDLDTVLSSLESAHWVSWDSFDTLINAAKNAQNDAIVPADSGISPETSNATLAAAQSLAASHTELTRFFTSVLAASDESDSSTTSSSSSAASATASASASASATASTSASASASSPAAPSSSPSATDDAAGMDSTSGNSSNSASATDSTSSADSANSTAPTGATPSTTSTGSDSPTASAAPSPSPTATESGRRGNLDSTLWQAQLEALHTAYAVRTLGAALNDNGGTVNDAMGLADNVLKLVHLQQPNSVVMMSSTASLPVTITNNAPFDVQVSVSARSGAASLAASGTDSVTIPAHSEQQVTLTLQAYSSGSTYVDLQLQDCHGDAVGGSIIVNVSNSLRLNDALGNAIIAIAAILAIGGLWRQFHRKPLQSEEAVSSPATTSGGTSGSGGNNGDGSNDTDGNADGNSNETRDAEKGADA
ncbi:DUF6049 family protein [Pseudoscardovia suis]|uniref:DUF6049 family protein n=1 Tax=Pseudoscardovia suis TaxID=987063 RepID=UPI003F9DEB48